MDTAKCVYIRDRAIYVLNKANTLEKDMNQIILSAAG